MVFSLLILFIAGTAKGSGPCFVAGPYVLHVNDRQAQVVWVSPPETPPGSITWMPEGSSNPETMEAQTLVPGFQSRPANGPSSGALPGYERGGRPLNPDEKLQADRLEHVRNLVYLESLEPHQRYSYEVLCGDGESTRQGRFRTAPAAGDRSTSFDFIVTADTHGEHDAVARAMGEQEADFVIIAGDFTGGHGHDWHRWLPYFESARPYHESSVLWPVVGGHDVQPALNFRAFFAFNEPDADPVYEGGAGTWYTYTYGNAQFFVLDHIYDLQGQQEWIVRELESSSAEWKIVVTHESMLNVGSRGNLHKCVTRDLTIDGVKQGVQYCYEELYGIFEEYGVDLVLFGHDHLYERKLPIGSPGSKPVHYISTRGGGSTREVRPSPVVANGIGYAGINYAHFRIEGNRLEMEARKPDGTLLDRMELIKDQEGFYQQEIMDQALDLELFRKLGHIYTSQSMAENITTIRRDLYGQFLSMPVAGEKAALLLYTGYAGTSEYDWSRFPLGSELLVYARDDPGGWKTERLEITITGDSARIEVTAPRQLSVSGEGLIPPLELRLNIRVDGREFEASTVRPTLTGFESPDKTHLLQPPMMGTVSSFPVFEWEEQPYASRYQYQITATNFSRILLDTTLAATTLMLPFELEPDEMYRWRVRAGSYVWGPWSDGYLFRTKKATSAESIAEVPKEFGLEKNYPNPFNPSTTIPYRVAEFSRITLRVYDMLGRTLAVLVDKDHLPGYYSVFFQPDHYSSGVYHYRLEAAAPGLKSQPYYVRTRSMTLLN